MSIKQIITLPDPILRQVSKPVTMVDDALKKLAHDMLETMYNAPGVGLAAVQVGEPIALLVVDVAGKDEVPAPRIVINPEIVWRADTRSVYEEGCLSIPEYYAEVERPESVRIRFMDLDEKIHEEQVEGLLATCLQHEIDHLNGQLFIDHISKLKRDIVIRKFKKLARDKMKDGTVL